MLTLFSSSHTVLQPSRISQRLKSQALKGTLLHKQLLEGVKHCTSVLPLLPAAQAQKPHQALQCNTHTMLYYGTFLYYYTGERGVFRISVSIFGSPTHYLYIHPARMNLVLTTI